MALSPGNDVLAARALSHALGAGDRTLALNAARVLERTGKLGSEGRLLLLGEALRTKDWRAAALHADRIEEDEVFSFMTPILRAWIGQGSRKGDPLALLQTKPDNQLGALYAQEHRPLLMILRGDEEKGVAELLTTIQEAGPREVRLRVAAAALLARKGEREQAQALLKGNSPPLAAAAALVAAKKKVPGEIATPSAGVAELLVRIALDLNGQQVPELALSFARLATFMAPEISETWLVTSELLAASEQHQAALAALEKVAVNDPFYALAAEAKVRMLGAAGRQAEALATAKAAADAAGANASHWTSYGDLLSRAGRHADAAEAYARGIEFAKNGAGGGTEEWTLWLLRGDALIEADRWSEAKASLEAAYRLAPNQAVVLNYLGYSQLERRENMDEAEKLIREASRLQPEDSAITDSLGWALYLRGKLPEAIEKLERAAQGEPADAAINEHLGDAYYAAGRRFEARYAWRAALLHAADDAADRLKRKIEVGLKPELAAP